MTNRQTCKPPFCTCGWHITDHEATAEERDLDYCYYFDCPDHHAYTPPGDPRARGAALIDFHNRDAKQRMLDKPEPSQETIQLWSQYMQLVEDDWEALYFGWLQAEKLGIAYFYFDHAETETENAEWRLR